MIKIRRIYMKQIVIYDSYFGNTATIAEKIAEELGCEFIKVHAFNATLIENYNRIVIGSPTRGFTSTKEIKTLVKKIKNQETQVAIFDTRMVIDETTPKILRFLEKRFGYSNDTLEKILTKNKIKLTQPPMAFYVGDSEGPLLEDEIEKAIKFAQRIKEN
jgi:menaquinone-dependent protoporphyrinogen IX oxidase